MILSEKIMSLRKQNGWSQEELSERLDVSRQSVSKWESGTSIPDIEKIIKMSQIFGVSTDYLLKESEDDEVVPQIMPVNEEKESVDLDSQARNISMEFASEFMETVKGASRKIATGVSLCILSPTVILLLGVISEEKTGGEIEGYAAGIGLIALFGLIAVAVLLFIIEGMKLSKYEFLEKEPIKLMYGVEATVNRKKEAFEPTFRISIAVGVILCILSVIPVAVAGAIDANDVICAAMVDILLAFIACGVFLFVSSGMIKSSYTKLLQEEGYDIETKNKNKRNESIYGAYWSLATAGYLAWSLITQRWESTWIVWPVAGVLFVPYKLLVDFITSKKN